MLMDIGVGILLARWVGDIYGVVVAPSLIFLGIVFAILPDMDFLLTKIPAIRKIIGEHRSATHYPAVHVVLGCMVFLMFGKIIATLYFVCVFYHLVHDTFFLGWGIKWLWPFSHLTLSIFHDHNHRISLNILMWTPAQESEIKKQYANPDWMRDFYFRPSIIAFMEYSVFLWGISTLYSPIMQILK